jgi:hypothetical protein
VSAILIVLLNTNCKPQYIATKTKLDVNSTLSIIPGNFWGALQISSVAIIVTYQVIFHPNPNHP